MEKIFRPPWNQTPECARLAWIGRQRSLTIAARRGWTYGHIAGHVCAPVAPIVVVTRWGGCWSGCDYGKAGVKLSYC
eukprot:scaffold58480_cov27-Tisochrysis_lutea.AAC.3